MTETTPKLKYGSKKWNILHMFFSKMGADGRHFKMSQLEIAHHCSDPGHYGVLSTVMTRIRELVTEGRLEREVGKDGRVRWQFRGW